jgi:predicted FMN-binding regulatory protein PaiB
LTRDEKDHETQSGVFNPIFDGKTFYIHLNRGDEQVRALRSSGSAALVFQDILAVIPSHWVDAHYGGAATAYYRFAEFQCSVKLAEEPAEMVRVLQAMLDRFQPEGGYDPLDPASARYRPSFEMLVIAELEPITVRAKWKLGQNRPESVRREVARRLRERAKGSDARAADEIERSIQRGAERAPRPTPTS